MYPTVFLGLNRVPDRGVNTRKRILTGEWLSWKALTRGSHAKAYLAGVLVRTRILVRQKRTGMEEIVRAVQVFGLSRNRVLEGDKVREAITSLLGGG